MVTHADGPVRERLLDAAEELFYDGGIAATGVDYLAVGALTHSAPALDLGLDLSQ